MMNRLPPWFRQEIPDANIFNRIHDFYAEGVNTVCQQARCPNLVSCWQKGHATFMILGKSCSRNCRFCAVDKNRDNLGNIDFLEPQRIARQINLFGIKFAVITSVSRDDLPLGGAEQFVKTIEAIRLTSRQTKIEVLIPDFQGDAEALKTVIDARPHIVAHNLETVPRLYPQIRPQADYQRSLNILKKIKEFDAGIITKSSLLLGMGETEIEVRTVISDLVSLDCDILTFGQYLAPSDNHYPVKEFIGLKQFSRYRDIALKAGIKSVLSGPKVRSSYQAEELYETFKAGF